MDPNALAPGLFLGLVFIGILALVVFFRFIPIGLWIRAFASGVRVPFLTLFGMRFRKVNPARIVDPLITATKAGLNLGIDGLEAHFLAGGDVDRVVRALISADKAGIDLGFKQATAIDLAGRDVFEAVQVSVNPKVITIAQDAASSTAIEPGLPIMSSPCSRKTVRSKRLCSSTVFRISSVSGWT
jgi:uncharacterized protein YqfA (UPF0365 family)